MNALRVAPIAFLLAAFSAAPAQAALCNLTIVEGVTRGLCELSTFFEGITTVVDVRKPNLIVNLQVDGIESFVSQGNFELGVKIENVGLGFAQAHDIHVVVVEQPRGSAPINHPFVVRATQGIPRHTSRGFFVGWVTLQNTAENTEFSILVDVDSPSAARPRGEVLEANEKDNVRLFSCVIYGDTNPTASSLDTCD